MRRILGGPALILVSLIREKKVRKAAVFGIKMDGYQYLIQRNKLMIQLEDDLGKLKDLPDPDRERETKKLQTRLDFALADLYAKVADEFPGERKKKARPISDPR